jgi:hypothetical protein
VDGARLGADERGEEKDAEENERVLHGKSSIPNSGSKGIRRE